MVTISAKQCVNPLTGGSTGGASSIRLPIPGWVRAHEKGRPVHVERDGRRRGNTCHGCGRRHDCRNGGSQETDAERGEARKRALNQLGNKQISSEQATTGNVHACHACMHACVLLTLKLCCCEDLYRLAVAWQCAPVIFKRLQVAGAQIVPCSPASGGARWSNHQERCCC